MPDYTPYQQKLISRYYDHRDGILLNRLQEIVTDLALTESDALKKRLWSRAKKAMASLQVPQLLCDHIVLQADPEVLAKHVRHWLDAAEKNSGK